MKSRWRVSQFAGSLTLAKQSKCPHGQGALFNSRHGPEIIRRKTRKVKNPSLPAVDEFLGTNIGMKVPGCRRLLVQELTALFTGENIVPFVDGLGSDDKLWYLTQGTAGFFHDEMAVYDAPGAEEIWRESRVAALRGIAFDVSVAEEPFFRCFPVTPGEPDNDHMNVRHAASIAAPGEGAVGEGDFEAIPVKEKRPELRNLFALGDGIGSHEADFGGRLPEVIAGFDEPGGDIVERSATPAQVGYPAHLRALLVTLIFRPAERRITKHVGAIAWG